MERVLTQDEQIVEATVLPIFRRLAQQHRLKRAVIEGYATDRRTGCNIVPGLKWTDSDHRTMKFIEATSDNGELVLFGSAYTDYKTHLQDGSLRIAPRLFQPQDRRFALDDTAQITTAIEEEYARLNALSRRDIPKQNPVILPPKPSRQANA